MAVHALRIEVADDMSGVGSYGPVSLHVSARTPTIARLKEVMKLQDRMAALGHATASLSVVEPTAVSPQSKEERDVTTQMMLRSPVRAAAIVVEGSGFRAAAARTVIAGFFLLKRPYPYRVFATADEGARWVVAMLARDGVRDVAPDALAAALQSLRAAMAQGGARAPTGG